MLRPKKLKLEFHINQLFSKLMKKKLIQELLLAKLILRVLLYQKGSKKTSLSINSPLIKLGGTCLCKLSPYYKWRWWWTRKNWKHQRFASFIWIHSNFRQQPCKFRRISYGRHPYSFELTFHTSCHWGGRRNDKKMMNSNS